MNSTIIVELFNKIKERESVFMFSLREFEEGFEFDSRSFFLMHTQIGHNFYDFNSESAADYVMCEDDEYESYFYF